MSDNEAVKLFKCLADESRLKILKSLIIEDMYVEQLANRIGLASTTVSFHLKKLIDAGAVIRYKSQYYTMYSLDRSAFQIEMIDILKKKATDDDLQKEREEEYKQSVIKAYFDEGKLKAIPVQQQKKRIVLRKIMGSFIYGKTYTEREVNIILADFHDDFCVLRKALVSEKFLDKTECGYRKLKEKKKIVFISRPKEVK